MNGLRWKQVLGAVLGALVLTGVTMMYLQPDFIVTMANQIWNCF